ncbi:MAG: aspartate-semialdehyde dehydrogenase [Gracilibacteraceae bacterium]|nr:aspartate-semialdehyde dehydrogenase [Gracilibacteraceae bacterium]
MADLAIVGATGAVGQEFLNILAERAYPVDGLRLLATKRSAGRIVSWGGREIEVEETRRDSFRGVDIAFFAGGSDSSLFAEAAVSAGAIVIDNSSYFRLRPDVPLVVPEVNAAAVRLHKGIIANPNCSTIIMAVALKPIEDAARVRRVVVSTYQAVSGAGRDGITELEDQIRRWAGGEPAGPAKVFPYQIAFNLIPRIDVFQADDYTKEEWKMTLETQKIFDRPDLLVTATCVRAPVLRSHAESINIETEKPLTPARAKELLAKAPGVRLVDDIRAERYPTPLETTNQDDVFVGRVRVDRTVANGLNLWAAGDQLRKGAALNGVQIAELLLEARP